MNELRKKNFSKFQKKISLRKVKEKEDTRFQPDPTIPTRPNPRPQLVLGSPPNLAYRRVGTHDSTRCLALERTPTYVAARRACHGRVEFPKTFTFKFVSLLLDTCIEY